MNNYYSAATGWSTSEFPRKRKGRNDQEENKRDTKQGERDWFLRRGERVEGGQVKRAKVSSSRNMKERMPLEEKAENVDVGAEASYSYRVPYQDENGQEA